MNAATPRSVFLVEDDRRLAALIAQYLDDNGFRVTVADLGLGVADQIHRAAPDLVILDLGLPGEDGFTICKQLRPAYANPILILTARKDDIDQILGLELGADDYVMKPVEPRVLVARINALFRRSSIRPGSPRAPMRFGRLEIDTVARAVRLAGDSITLSSNEFDLLVRLAMHAGVIQSRETLFRHLYGREYDGFDRVLDVRVSHLRRKLGDDAESPNGIKTIWGHGYLFNPSAW